MRIAHPSSLALLALIAAACGSTEVLPSGDEPLVAASDDEGVDDSAEHGFDDVDAADDAEDEVVDDVDDVVEEEDVDADLPPLPEGEAPSTPSPEEQESAPATAPMSTSTPRAIERDLKVLHWNIAGGKENACQTAGITRAVRRYVVEHDIDFVGLNEVCPAQYESIRAALAQVWGKPRGVTFSAYVGDGDGNKAGRTVGNAIFSKRTLDTILKERVGEDRFGFRNLLCGRVKNRPHLRFCSTHLTPGDTAARRQMVLVKNRVEGFWVDRSDTVLLAGDLNLNADDRGLDFVYSANANTRNNGNNRGRYREADDNDAAHCKGYGERSHAGSGGPCGTGGKIDFIFARQNRIVDGGYSGDSLDIPQDCTGACSDHRAIVGRYRVKIRVD